MDLPLKRSVDPCRNLGVNVNTLDSDLSVPPSCTISPNFNIADILTPPFEQNSTIGSNNNTENIASPDMTVLSPSPNDEPKVSNSTDPLPVKSSVSETETSTLAMDSSTELCEERTHGADEQDLLVHPEPQTEVSPDHPPSNLCDLKSHRRLSTSTVYHISINGVRSESPPSPGRNIVDMVDDSVCTASSLNYMDQSRFNIEGLLDAARCARAEAQVEEAEAVFDQLLSKLAESKDLSTTWENLSSDNSVQFHSSMTEPVDDSPPRAPVFSPVLGFLLSQPECCIFPQLFRPSPAGQKLQELCNQLANALRRAKRKLRIIQRVRARQSANNSKVPSHSIPRPSTSLSTPERIASRRTEFVQQINRIWPGPDDLPRPQPQVYTNPVDCPLSLLSLVSDLERKRTKQPSPNPSLSSLCCGSCTQNSSLHPDALSVQVTMPGSTSEAQSLASWPNTSGDVHLAHENQPRPLFSFAPSSLSPSSTSTISCGRQSNRRARRRQMVRVLTNARNDGVKCASGSKTQPVRSLPNSPMNDSKPNLKLMSAGPGFPSRFGYPWVMRQASVTRAPWVCHSNGVSPESHQAKSLHSPMPVAMCSTKSPQGYTCDVGLWSNNRPPTPDIRRSDLDMADLSDGTRVLVIQGTHLRAGTLYLNAPSTTTLPDRTGPSPEAIRNQMFRIHLDFEKTSSTPSYSTNQPTGRRCSSPARFLSDTLRSPKKRRQADVLLYGWQVIQQAVLEVFPASIRHLPPGTRVCAAWSHQLAWNLYPGTVAEVGSPPEEGCVAVDFDDGDHRQVPIHGIRMLPDNFTNLHELARSSGAPISDLSVSDHLNNGLEKPTGWPRNRSRVRHNSAVETSSSSTLMGNKRKWSETTTPRLPKSSTQTSGCSSAALSDSPDVHSLVSPKKVSESQNMAMTPTTSMFVSCSSAIMTTIRTDEPSPCDPYKPASYAPVSDQVSSHALHKDDATVPSSSLSIDQDSLLDTSSIGTSSESESVSWQILEKLPRRKHARVHCRSIIREADGLTVAIGDTVEFISDQDDVYLGEIRDIYWSQTENAPVVTATWYYQPSEAGADGQRILGLKGAVFATRHQDKNEARCIKNRAIVYSSYAKYIEHYKTQPHANGNTDENQTILGTQPSQLYEQNNEPTVYFVAGKYDPVNKRIISWDPDVLQHIALQ